MTRGSPTGPGNRTDWRLRALIVGFVLFVAGGFYFGYALTPAITESERQFEPVDVPDSTDSTVLPADVVLQPPKPGDLVEPKVPPPAAGKRINILLLGIDERPSSSGAPSRTDTMIVATLDLGSQTAALFSIPRDLWVAIPRGDGQVVYHKINAAHAFGQVWRYPDGSNSRGGPDLAKKTVEQNLGIPIHYYARIDFEGFVKAVDLVGGVEVDVPEGIVDTMYRAENNWVPPADTYFAAGRQHMDGATALRYVRTRNPDTDFGRMARQRQVLLALRDKASRLDMLPRLPQVLSALRGSLDTDIPLDKTIQLANVARGIKADNIATYAIGRDMVLWDQPVVGALSPKRQEIERLVDEVFFSPLPDE